MTCNCGSDWIEWAKHLPWGHQKQLWWKRSQWMVVFQYTTFLRRKGVTSCPPGLTAASSYATASCLYIEEARAKGKVGHPLTNVFDSLTHSANAYCLYLHTSNMALRVSLWCLVERLWVVAVMCHGQIPNQWGGMEGGSEYPGLSPNFAAALDNSHPFLEHPHKSMSLHLPHNYNVMIYGFCTLLPYHEFSEERTVSRSFLFSHSLS